MVETTRAAPPAVTFVAELLSVSPGALYHHIPDLRDLRAGAVLRQLETPAAMTLLAIDLLYVPRRRIRPTYLLDAAMQAGWLTAWLRCGRLAGPPSA